jgi:hypothetical protein
MPDDLVFQAGKPSTLRRPTSTRWDTRLFAERAGFFQVSLQQSGVATRCRESRHREKKSQESQGSKSLCRAVVWSQGKFKRA